MNEFDLRLLLYIAVMAGVTYLVRMLPFVIFRRKITSPFIKSVLYYMPYAVLSAMTIPAVFTSAGADINGIIASVAGVVIAVLLSIKKASLLTVAAAACVTVYVISKLMLVF